MILHPIGFWNNLGGKVRLSGGSSSHFVADAAVFAGVTFHQDGYCYDLGPGLADRTLFNAGEWWVDVPETGIGSSYDVRCESLSTGTWNIQAATVGTWIQISTERVWRENVVAMDAPNTEACTGLFQIRPNGGTAILAAEYYSASAAN